ncbi:MAG: hypothetical protein V4724_08355 [Pseudomonadota bacterium]
MKRQIELNIELEDETGAGQCVHMAVSVFLPAPALLPAQPLLIFGLPGGGYARAYYAMEFAGHADYSQAAYHTAHGAVFIAIDHLGTGQSSVPDLAALTIAQMAQANHRVVEKVTAMFAAGSIDAGFPALSGCLRIGIGQSMGGCIGVVMQGRHRSFDAYAALGYSVLHTALPQRPGVAALKAPSFARDSDLSAISIQAESAAVGDFSYGFHWHDEPAELVAADFDGGFPIRRQVPPFGSATTPYCALQMLMPDCVAGEAALVDVPVFLAFGELDIAREPRREPQAYPNSPDIALLIVPRMAHMHNFAGTRHYLWRRLQHWAEGLAFRPLG